MSTIFIAVQCIQCSTMQVKQQKKSSSKWVCAVCNQRQSFRRIHARGYLARDLRKFVQEFNLSRSVQEASHNASVSGRSDEFLVGSEIGDSSSCGGTACWLGKRRIDWSEYLDPEEDDHRADDGEGTTVAKGIGGSGTIVEQGLSKWRKYLEDEDRGLHFLASWRLVSASAARALCDAPLPDISGRSFPFGSVLFVSNRNKLIPDSINSFLQNSGKHVLIFLISAVAQVYGDGQLVRLLEVARRSEW